MKRLARSAVEEMPEHLVSVGLKAAGKDTRMEHAERDLLKLFRTLGMSLPLKVELYQHGFIFVAHLKLRAWFTLLLKERSELLFAGFNRTRTEAELALTCFWQNFKVAQPDHEVFRTHGDRLQHCLPYYLFLDEGVGLRKSGVLVVSFEMLVGSDTADAFVRNLQNGGRRPNLMQVMSESQCHNARGRTWDSRFLYTVLPKKAYKNNGVFPKLLGWLADECVELTQHGVTVRGVSYYPICLGVKGDAPMQAKVGNFQRSFANMGYNKGCCFECKAGLHPYCFEDTRFTPDWESTIFSERPYRDPSPLLRIPARPSAPEAFFKRDPFHTFKQSIGCSFLSSTIVLLCEMGYWPGPSESVPEQLKRSYTDFAFFVKREWPGKNMQSLKSFTKELFHWPRVGSYPAGRFKGGDCSLMMRWVHHVVLSGVVDVNVEPHVRSGSSLLQNPLELWHAPFLQQILKASAAGIKFFQVLHRSGCWLARDVMREVGLNAARFTQAFSELASLCHGRDLPRYHLVPSLHAFHHFWVDCKLASSNPAASYCLSPNTSNCEANEDFVGKIARLSRKVHARSTAHRTLERYLVKLWCEWAGIR